MAISTRHSAWGDKRSGLLGIDAHRKASQPGGLIECFNRPLSLYILRFGECIDQMPSLILEIVLIVLLIIGNGVFVMSEIAIISARKIRLKQRADEGDLKARTALDLANSPNRFLSTTQIGVTLISTAVGAFGGASVAGDLAVILDSMPALRPYSSVMSIAIIVLAISYLSLVIGELVPKRLGLNSPEKIASRIAGPMIVLSVIASPAVRLLSISTDLVLKVMRIKPSLEPPVTEEDIKILIDEGTRAGVFEEAEQDIVERVFRLSDRRAASLMIPRSDAICLDVEESPEEMREKIGRSDYMLFPVCRGGFDNVLGFINPRYLLSCSLNNEPVDLKSSLIPPLFIPETMPALKILELFKQSEAHIAMVIDEYGSVIGLVTLRDILEAIVGDLPPIENVEEEPMAVKRDDGSWLLDGMLPADEFKEIFHLGRLPEEDSGYYQTIGGFVMMRLGKIPSVSDHFEWGGLRFEVVDMDENRVDKLLVTPLGKAWT